MNYFKKNLKYVRTIFGLTQEETATVVNKIRGTIGNWESGVSEPNIDELARLSAYFDIRLDIFVLVDIEKKQLITGSHIEEFHKKGKLKQNPVEYDTTKLPTPRVEEEQEHIDMSVIMDQLDRINNNIRKLRSEINTHKK